MCGVLLHDSYLIASSTLSSCISIWNPHTGAAIHSLKGHTMRKVLGIACSNDDDRLFSSGRDGTLRLWKCTDGKELIKLTSNMYV